MSKEYQVAVAITVPLYEALKDTQEGRFLMRHGVKTRLLSVPDGDYVIIAGNWIELHDDWTDFLKQVEQKRHSILTISDSLEDGGEIWRDVETEDDEGWDEAFAEILGWTTNICLWEDPSQIIV